MKLFKIFLTNQVTFASIREKTFPFKHQQWPSFWTVFPYHPPHLTWYASKTSRKINFPCYTNNTPAEKHSRNQQSRIIIIFTLISYNRLNNRSSSLLSCPPIKWFVVALGGKTCWWSFTIKCGWTLRGTVVIFQSS